MLTFDVQRHPALIIHCIHCLLFFAPDQIMIKRTNLVYGKSLIRCFASASTDPVIKPNLSLLSKIRKVTQLPMNKIKESLIKNSNSYDDAMKWLNNEMANNQSKVEKLSGRIANEVTYLKFIFIKSR